VASALVGKSLWSIISPLMVAKKLSATALSQQSPLPLMLRTAPAASSVPRYWALAYTLPRSEWWMKPAGGLRVVVARASAASASVVSLVPLVAQPTTRREQRSRMAAR
jgi:hypothetical protein